MFENSSAKHYLDNKERLLKKTCERYQSFSKEEKEKTSNLVVKNTKTSQKMKKKKN